jgi:hypothetical protein
MLPLIRPEDGRLTLEESEPLAEISTPQQNLRRYDKRIRVRGGRCQAITKFPKGQCRVEAKAGKIPFLS